MKTDNIMANEQIKAARLIVIDENGEKLGEFLKSDAIALAESKSLDIVQVGESNGNAVCKIMDFGKYIYDLKKKEKEKINSSNNVKTKEIQFGYQSDENYLDIKAKQARKFLEDGNKVLLVVKYRGREAHHTSVIKAKCMSFISRLEDIATMEADPKFGSNSVTINLVKK